MVGFQTALTAAIVVAVTSSTGAGALHLPAASVIAVGRGPAVVGSGRIVSQRRPVGNFRTIEVRDAADVAVRVGPRQSLVVTTDDNLLPLIRSQIRNRDKLVVESVGSYRTARAPRITITVPRLAAFALRGSGDAVIEGVNGDSLALAIAGSGDIRARGRTGSLSVAINGSGDVDARQLVSRNAAVVISGSGDATVRASGALTGVTQGSGTVNYIGRPAMISVRTAGAGSVRQAR
ncbi:head GIN domain-containing protein [Sphingomonas sp. GCM10030256]|uniref:head GIN domain-containing protein n=1 Tax=Sphingomonas sp. GCM10030256 TaxID=3273427 RepID=UPI0036070E72